MSATFAQPICGEVETGLRRLTLSPCGSASLMDLPRPPVKAGSRADQSQLLLEGSAPRQLYFLATSDPILVALRLDPVLYVG